MGQGQVNGQQPKQRQTSRTFKITLIAIVIATILLGGLIAWLLLTQDLTKASILLSLIASIVAILVGPITLLFTIPRSAGEHHSHSDSVANSTATQPLPLTTQPLLLPPSQAVSNAPLPTSHTSQGTFDTHQVKEDGTMTGRKQFDVFLSYSSKDKNWVNHLKEALEKQRLKVWLDHEQIRPGDMFTDALERGLEESKTMALIVSPESMESGWVEEEYRRALSLTKQKHQPLQLIPVILREAELPGFLASRQWVDFREESMFAQSLEKLIWGITGKKPTASDMHSKSGLYQAGYPLSGDTTLYIERNADQVALVYLRKMEYISFIEPSLQGKSSLIYRLMKKLAPSGYAFVICDLMNERFRKESEEEWYRSLGKWVLNNLNFIADEEQPALPVDSTTWQPFLEAIAKAATEAKQKIVIVLDMLQVFPQAYATPFFTVIRSIYTERAITPVLYHLTFITSGAFNPKELIQDDAVSKFNVDQRIELEDFNLTQVTQVVDNLQLPDDVTEAVAKRVYYWTDGQPYLTQRICLLLAGVPELEPYQPPQITREVDKLARQLSVNQQSLNRFRRLRDKEPNLFQYVQNIASGHKTKFNPVLSDEQFRLANIYGVIKADAGGHCQMRNRICGQALRYFSMHVHY